MKQSTLSVVLLLLSLAACSDGPTEPREVFVEGFVADVEDGSPIQGASITATRTWCVAVDLDFCRNETKTYDSAETDSTGYYHLSYPASGCVDIRVSQAGYVALEDAEVCSLGGEQRVDLTMRLRDPFLRIRGSVKSSIDEAVIEYSTVGVYREIDAEERIASDVTNWAGRYDIRMDCEEVVYVQARCVDYRNLPNLGCRDWRDSERVPLTSDCPERGSTENVAHYVNFVLDPISE
jgi:hypothetical protein